MTSDNPFPQTSCQVGSAEGAQGEMKIIVSNVDDDDSERPLWSPTSNDTSETGSPPLLAVSPPTEQSDLSQDEQDDVHHFYDAHSDLEACAGTPEVDRRGSFSRTSGSGPGKSRSPSRSSPRRHSPTPYSPSRQHRSYSGSSAMLEGLADVSLSPRRRASLPYTPQRLRTHSNGSLTSEEYLEVTLPSANPSEVVCKVVGEPALSPSLSLDSDPGDVEMSPMDTAGVTHQRDVCELPTDPFSMHPSDIALLTDDSSDDDLSSSGSDKENTMEDMVPQHSPNSACYSVSSETNIPGKHFHAHVSCGGAASKDAFRSQAEDAKTQGQRCSYAATSVADTMSVQSECASTVKDATHCFQRPGVTHTDRAACKALPQGVSPPNSPDDENRHERHGEDSQMAATGVWASSIPPPPPPPPHHHHHQQQQQQQQHSGGNVFSQSSPSCTCGGAGMRSAFKSSSSLGSSLPLKFPHSLDAVLLHPEQHNPYDPDLPTPPIVLTPHTSYDALPHCYPVAEDDRPRPDEAFQPCSSCSGTHSSDSRSDREQSSYEGEGTENWTSCLFSETTSGRSGETGVNALNDYSRQQHSTYNQVMDHQSGDDPQGWSRDRYGDSSPHSVPSQRQHPGVSDKQLPGSRGGGGGAEERHSGASQSGFNTADPGADPCGSGSQGSKGNPRAALIGKLRQVVERRLSSSEDPDDSR